MRVRGLTKRDAAGAALVALGALTLATPLGEALAQLTGDSSEPESPSLAPAELVEPATPEPETTSQDESQALEIIAANAQLQRLLQDKQYEVLRIGPWGGEDEHGNLEPLTGVAVELQLADPASFPMQEWPLLEYRPERAQPYRVEMLRFAAENATQLLVNVDLGREQVVYIEPYGENVKLTLGADLREQIAAPTGE